MNEDWKERLGSLASTVGIPLAAVVFFLALWSAMAASIETSIGALPGPTAVWRAATGLAREHVEERRRASAFYERMDALRREKEAAGGTWTPRKYSGKPTYVDQILTSLKTVFAGFVIASLIAIPIGILCGLSDKFYAAVNPLVQLFRPVSPLAWLPIVMILVSALYTSRDPLFEKSFVSSAITVALCSLWPTLVNTALGVGSVDPDHVNVARVLNLSWPTRVTKIMIPAALPLIFTGLRLSLGVGWMVLIAAEMLAQNPGLGKFVWDMFQNGSSETLARILVAVLTIGTIGLVLDRMMIVLQKAVSYDDAAA